ncbi:Importin beta-2 subunit [Mycena kentingensis (nom. inval.)]|nr:Importin beta-2 subunit [Mycena kentingensis (nom. inval.)]
MAAWAPQPQGLQEVLQTLHESTDMNVAVQRAITQKLNNFTRAPEYIAYLAYILTQATQEEDRIRTIAGYLLKNNARLILTSAPEVAHYVKAAILQAFNDDSVMIRNAAGQDIVAFLGQLEPRNWPECLQQLMNTLQSPDLDRQEAAFNVLEKACEDYPRKMDIEINGTRPLDYMIPEFLKLTNHASAKMRSHAIACLSYFVPVGSQSLFVQLDAFIAALFKLASDDDPSVRRHVCQALVLLLAARPEKLMPEMNNVAEYMLYSTKDKNENVALEACEFWLTFAEDPDLAIHLHPLLPKVAPVLLDCMVYGEDDLLWLEGDAEDAEVPDKETDIKPRHYGGGKSHGLEREAGENGAPKAPRVGAYGEETIDSDDEEDYYDDDFADEMSTEWNLRKCAAAALDVLAVRFSGDLLNVLLGPLKEKLWSSDWLQRESGILALGAMAEGCIESIEPHLPTLIPYLISTLSDSKACFGSRWTTQPISEEHKNQYFVPTMEGLLRMVLDNNKRVQEAGCSAFATLEEDAGMELAPYLEPVLQNLVVAFDKYQHKNMLILYDAVGTLADAVGRSLQNPHYVDILMPPLTKRWARLKDDDEDLIPLLECLASVTIAIGTAFVPYAQPVFERCCNIIHNSLLKYQAYQNNPETEEPDKSFLVVALDLLSGLTQGMGMELAPLIQASEPPLLALLTVCLKHPQAPVRQSAYALVGDMAMGCFVLLRPHMPGIMQELTLQLDPEPKYDFISASNNAAWSVGEVALRYGRDDAEFKQWVNQLIARLIPILLHPKAPRSLHENAAVSIGRIGLTHPDIVAQHLPEFAQAWCQALYEIRDNEEKDSAFRGFCTLVQHNPQGIAKVSDIGVKTFLLVVDFCRFSFTLQSLLWFCNAVVRWNQPSAELNEMFRTLLQGFKGHDPAAWQAQVSHFPQPIQERLAARYGV